MQDKHHVCTKMFGGGMGDQIKRYCELLNPEVLYSIKTMDEGKDGEDTTFTYCTV
jgi:hypothetical protein